jgi:hypothetical protein
MLYALGKQEMHITYWPGNLTGSDHLGELITDRMITLILGKEEMQTGLNWLITGSNDGIL